MGRNHRGARNHVLLAAERNRTRTHAGQYVRVALSDVAFWMVGNLGKIAEVEINRHERVKDGNYLYGAFGRDFRTRDGRRIMIVALTSRQWHSLVAATDLGEACASIGQMMDVDLNDEGGRFAARELIGATLRPWVLSRSMAEVREIFDAHDVCWGPYQTFTELVEQDPRCSPANSAVRQRRATGDRHLPNARLAAGLRGGRAPRAPARTDIGRAHRGGAGRRAGPVRRGNRAAARRRRRGGRIPSHALAHKPNCALSAWD